MKTRHALAILVALLVTPLALSLGALLLIPVVMLLVPAALAAGVAALPALLVSVGRSGGQRRATGAGLLAGIEA